VSANGAREAEVRGIKRGRDLEERKKKMKNAEGYFRYYKKYKKFNKKFIHLDSGVVKLKAYEF
jgi:hypothetical protein